MTSEKPDDAEARERELRAMFATAQRIISEIKRKRMLPAAWGVTVLVHTGEIQPGDVNCALSTTLPSRAVTRLVIAESLVQMCMADGAQNGEQAAAMVVSDVRANSERMS